MKQHQNTMMMLYNNNTLTIVSAVRNSYVKELFVQKDQLGIAKENRDVFYPREVCQSNRIMHKAEVCISK